MGRPKGSKNKGKKDDAYDVLAKEIAASVDADILEKIAAKAKELERFCKECDGILFGGQVIHKKGCSRA